MPRDRHGNWEVEVALLYAEARGWRVEPTPGHALGRLCGPSEKSADRDDAFEVMSVWSSPKSAHQHARQIRRVVDRGNTVTAQQVKPHAGV